MKEGDIVVCTRRSYRKAMFNEKYWFLHFITLSSYIYTVVNMIFSFLIRIRTRIEVT